MRTAQPGRLLRQLCNHWRHKFPVERDAERSGRVALPAAVCELRADDGTLHVRLSLSDAAAIDRTERVVAEHLQRFAQGETLVFDWARQPAG